MAAFSRILIAGPSASGKSTVARALASRLGYQRLCLDDYFIPRAKVFVDTPQGRIRSFERPQLYDGASIARDIMAANGGIVAEGFCLFHYPEITSMDAIRIYLDVPFRLCLARRAARRPQRLSDASFAIIGEDETHAIVVPQQRRPGVRVLSGQDLDRAIADILNLLATPAA